MTKHDTSVFTDDTGSRRRWVTVALRGAVAAIALGTAAIAASIFGHVTLPGLDAPLHVPGANHGSEHSADEADDASDQGSTAPDTVAPAETTATPTPTTKVTGKPTAKPTKAATPPSERPTQPPGRPDDTGPGA